MLPELLISLLAIATLVSSGIALFYFRKLLQLSKGISEKEQQVKDKLYEVSLFDNIRQRFGYSIHLREIFDVVVTSIPEIAPVSTISYLLVEGNKLIFKAYLNEKISRDYIEQVKSDSIQSLRNINPLFVISPHIEESLAGNLVDVRDQQKPAYLYDVPLYLGNDLVGIFTISSSQEKNLDKKYNLALIQSVIDRVMTEVGKLKELFDHEKTKLEVMVENMSDGVVMIDNDFSILEINKSCLGFLGLANSDDVTIFDIVRFFSTAVPLEQKISQVFESGRVVSVPDIHIGEKYYDIFVIPVNGRIDVRGVGIIVKDKTEEVELTKLREEFTSMVVHELRSPLTVILDTADLMSKRYAELTSEQVFSLLEQVKRSSSSLLTIVSDLLDLAKIEAGKMKVTKKSGDINKLLFERMSYYKHLAEKKGLELTIDIDSKIGAFEFDYLKIEQVLNNLLSNAIKFTDQGSVRIASRLIGDYVKVSVIDTGMGISHEDKTKLFNKFERLQSAESMQKKGTGLGLAITKGIVESHGGSVFVEDNVPCGVVIAFTLPFYGK